MIMNILTGRAGSNGVCYPPLCSTPSIADHQQSSPIYISDDPSIASQRNDDHFTSSPPVRIQAILITGMIISLPTSTVSNACSFAV
ncbi:hypothetical protein PoB_001091900 [Plakobranchus ocellatus]|uniref:Uncharacterized protein n=1 Tax=Plakobranchus ocellatus TaxID=259542 RepID=A0AAV3YQV9_9GAST|nr:hypothetical protein PoB_001091900 [Plakobranchus ocellatus]